MKCFVLSGTDSNCFDIKC